MSKHFSVRKQKINGDCAISHSCINGTFFSILWWLVFARPGLCGAHGGVLVFTPDTSCRAIMQLPICCWDDVCAERRPQFHKTTYYAERNMYIHTYIHVHIPMESIHAYAIFFLQWQWKWQLYFGQSTWRYQNQTVKLQHLSVNF